MKCWLQFSSQLPDIFRSKVGHHQFLHRFDAGRYLLLRLVKMTINSSNTKRGTSCTAITYPLLCLLWFSESYMLGWCTSISRGKNRRNERNFQSFKKKSHIQDPLRGSTPALPERHHRWSPGWHGSKAKKVVSICNEILSSRHATLNPWVWKNEIGVKVFWGSSFFKGLRVVGEKGKDHIPALVQNFFA